MMVSWPALPYESIGKVAVVLAAIALLAAITFVLFLAFLFVWYRGWDRITNLLWRGYDPSEGEVPPKWRLEASFYAQAIKNRDLGMVSTFRENAHKLGSNGDGAE